MASEEIPKEAKVLYYEKYGKEMKLGPLPVPEVADNQVLLKVHAASINPIDYKRRNGALRALVGETFPVRLGYDAAGVIVKAGSAVKDFKVGDEVFARVKDSMTGTVGEYLNVEEYFLAKKPANISFVEAAATPLAAETAYQALERIGVKEGSSILITGGAGGVGTYAIQLAKHVFKAGRVVTTASPGAKTDLVKSLGADEVVNYRNPKWASEFKDPVDNAFDTAGEAANCIAVVKEGAKVVSIADKPTADELAQVMPVNFIVRTFLRIGSWSMHRAASGKKAEYSYLFLKANGKDLSKIAEYMESGKVKAIIDSTFEFDKAIEAMEKLESGRAQGKIVIKITA